MADAISVLSDTLDKFKVLTLKPEIFLSANNDVANRLQEWAKDTYDVLRSTGTLSSEEILPELFIEEFDDEQIWQEIELQNNPAIDLVLKDVSVLKTVEPSFYNTTDNGVPQETNEQEEFSDQLDEEDRDDELEASDDEDEPLNLDRNLEEPDSDNESEEEKELKKMLDRATMLDGGDQNEDSGDDDEALFNVDLMDDDGDTHKPNIEKTKGQATLDNSKRERKRKTVVDDTFFNIADLETFLDREDAREEKRRRKEEKGGESEESESEDENEDEENIDFFADIPSDEEAKSSRDLRYKDFFDPPDGVPHDANSEDDFSEKSDDQNELSEVGEESKGSRKKDLFADDDEGDDDNKGLRSAFEERQERLAKRIKALESENLGEKAWQLGGEVGGAARPENSLLQEDLDFEQQTRAAPEITEETTKSLEDIIKQRIKDQSWDDVERKIKPSDAPSDYKKKAVLDMEKSKKTLSEMYEEEYLKQAETEKEEKEDPKHVEIKKMMTSLFIKLDAMSNFHYTPKPDAGEVKVISNLPSVTVEEVAPVTMSEAAMLAPEEIQDKQQRELKGDTEKTKEDKKSERRLKKQAQRKRKADKEKQRKLVEKLNPGLGNKYAKQNAMEDLAKQSKGIRSNVTIVKGGDTRQKSDLTSSSKFFSKLQDQVSSRIKEAKSGNDKKKKKQNKSSAKLML